MALGAAVGEAVLGRRVGRAAAVWGAVLGTLPDLDVLIPYAGAVENFTYHRSFSHSLIVLTLVAPFIAMIVCQFEHWRISRTKDALAGQWQAGFLSWWLLCWLALVTHPLLDGFTIYGTQLFWPLSEYRLSGAAIFIIDPVYTTLLLIGLVCAFKMRSPVGQWVNLLCLSLATSYLAWALYARLTVEQIAYDSFAQQGISYRQLLATPMPLNTIGWRIIARTDNGYYESWYSFLDLNKNLQIDFYPSDDTVLDSLQSNWAVNRLQWFTHGFYKVQVIGGDVVITDLRLGLEGLYVFAFNVARMTAKGPEPIVSRQLPTPIAFDRVPLMMRRVLGEPVSLAPL